MGDRYKDGTFNEWSRDSGAGVVTRLQVGQLRNHASIPGRGKTFCRLQSAQTGSGAHPASYSIGSRELLPQDKAPGA